MFVAEIFIDVLQVVLFCVLGFYLYRFMVRALSGFTDVPYVPTDRGFLSLLDEALDIHDGDIVYDLGCGDGRVLFYCARKHSGATFVGIEKNPLLFLQATAYAKISGLRNVRFQRKDIFEFDFSDATKIFAFLLPEVMRDLAPILKASRIVSRAFEIPRRLPSREFVLKDAPAGPWNTFTVYVYNSSPTGPTQRRQG